MLQFLLVRCSVFHMLLDLELQYCSAGLKYDAVLCQAQILLQLDVAAALQCSYHLQQQQHEALGKICSWYNMFVQASVTCDSDNKQYQ